MNLTKKKIWETIDIAKGGYAETGYEYFETIHDVPLMKAKNKEIWYIGTIYDGEKLKTKNLFTDENAARQAFESVKRFQESELASRYRFNGKSVEYLQDWLTEFGSNPYIGDSVYRYYALKELKQAESNVNNNIQGEKIMEDKITAIVKYPQKKPQTIALEKGLKPLQEIIGGIITSADLPDIEGVVGFVHDEGLLIGLEPNIYRPEYEDALVGPLVFVGEGDGGNDVSLTPEQTKQVMNYLEQNSVRDFGEFLYHIETRFAYYKPKKQMEM